MAEIAAPDDFVFRESQRVMRESATLIEFLRDSLRATRDVIDHTYMAIHESQRSLHEVDGRFQHIRNAK